MNMEEMTVIDVLGYECTKTNPITTEAKNILNKLFKDELGFFDSGRANRVEWFLPREIKDMELFVKLDDCINFSHNLIEASNGYERQHFVNGKIITNEKFNFFITQENKDFLKNAIVNCSKI
jgi:hypothetical protein